SNSEERSVRKPAVISLFFVAEIVLHSSLPVGWRQEKVVFQRPSREAVTRFRLRLSHAGIRKAWLSVPMVWSCSVNVTELVPVFSCESWDSCTEIRIPLRNPTSISGEKLD